MRGASRVTRWPAAARRAALPALPAPERDGDRRVFLVHLGFGYQRLGRFAEAYRNRFGETPSATRGRRRTH